MGFVCMEWGIGGRAIGIRVGGCITRRGRLLKAIRPGRCETADAYDQLARLSSERLLLVLLVPACGADAVGGLGRLFIQVLISSISGRATTAEPRFYTRVWRGGGAP